MIWFTGSEGFPALQCNFYENSSFCLNLMEQGKKNWGMVVNSIMQHFRNPSNLYGFTIEIGGMPRESCNTMTSCPPVSAPTKCFYHTTAPGLQATLFPSRKNCILLVYIVYINWCVHMWQDVPTGYSSHRTLSLLHCSSTVVAPVCMHAEYMQFPMWER